MNSQNNDLNMLDIVPSDVDLEFLAALLEPEDATYPWNLNHESAEAYFQHLELQFDFPELLETELTTSANNFYENLDMIWDQVAILEQDNFSKNTVNYLQQALENSFAVIPKNLLGAIAQKASEVFTLEQSVSEKLVECVQGLLPNWGTDDLLVLARPFAYSMRSSKPQPLTSVIRDFENRNWDNLSEIEQAKITLAIADYALQYLSQPNH